MTFYYTPAEFARFRLGFRLDPRSARAWTPPAGEAGLEFVNKPGVRRFAVVCEHGAYASTFAEWSYAESLYEMAHPECPIGWVRKEWWPAAAAVKAALGVTATPTPVAQRALAVVRRHGEAVNAYIAAHPCATCVPGVAETAPIADPDQVVTSIEHERGCPAREV